MTVDTLQVLQDSYTGDPVTLEHVETAAEMIGCEPGAIAAVAEVESHGGGFVKPGMCKILYERHIFARETQGRFNVSHPHISLWQGYGPGGYGPAGEPQWKKLREAYLLDPDAALRSCSWGGYQIMGFNHRLTGSPSIRYMVQRMCESEVQHLNLFVRMILHAKNTGIREALILKHWENFAFLYNGVGYKQFRYHIQIAEAYARLR
jgi:hypothetical protein